MARTCNTCGKKCEGEYCFAHKPRKPLPSGRGLTSKKSSLLDEKLDKSRDNILIMRDFFLSIWGMRPHRSEVSGAYLGSEPMSTYFHHILPKNKYPQASLDEENIIILSLHEHEAVESDIYKYEEVNKRRELLKAKYGIL
jgi:hypothetical protein